METQANNSSSQERGLVTYEVSGEQVKLSLSIVRNYLTRGNSAVSDADVVQFIHICRANCLNPFIGDAYLVKYKDSPAQIIESKASFMKRGEESGVMTGYRAGVILVREGKIAYEEGSFFLPSDQLVGGWAEVTRKDRKTPIIVRVRLTEYNSGKSTWSKMPGTMIRKVALAQAFREAFPMKFGHTYVPEEEGGAPDEQVQQQPVENPNTVRAVFQEAEPDEVVKDTPEPVEFDADPVPEDLPDPEPIQEAELNEDFFNI